MPHKYKPSRVRYGLEFPDYGFWKQVDKSGGDDACWIWNGYKLTSGYGQYYHVGAHRVAWIETHGDIPDNLLVCHHCDNPSCVNPKHLFLGTHRDNTQDMIAKGRGRVNRH